jgi:hypothetical protein
MYYNKMSNREIDRAIVDLLFGKVDQDINRLFNSGKFNYCTSAIYAWPIIKACCMSIELCHSDLGDTGTCTSYNPTGKDWQEDFYNNDDVFRTAMICYLKSQE